MGYNFEIKFEKPDCVLRSGDNGNQYQHRPDR